MHNKQEREYDFRFRGVVINLCLKYMEKNVDDMLQEGFLVYNKCNIMYPDVNIRHFMSLFKSAFSNHFYTLYRKSKKRQHLPLPEMVECKHIFPELSDKAKIVLQDFTQDYKLHFRRRTLSKKFKKKYGISLKNFQLELLGIV